MPRPYMPPEIVRLIDALARAEERAERLRAMNGGNRGTGRWSMLLGQAACRTRASCWPRAPMLAHWMARR